MSARRLTVIRIHPDGREGAPVPGLTPARARGLVALFLTDKRWSERAGAVAFAQEATRRLGETVPHPSSGAAVRVERTAVAS